MFRASTASRSRDCLRRRPSSWKRDWRLMHSESRVSREAIRPGMSRSGDRRTGKRRIFIGFTRLLEHQEFTVNAVGVKGRLPGTSPQASIVLDFVREPPYLG